jgi:hypothetical protein
MTMTQHSTFVDIDGRFCLANEDDPYYTQVFTNAAEYFAFIEKLIADGNKHFGRRSRLCDGVSVAGCIRDDFSDGEHASEFAKPVGE